MLALSEGARADGGEIIHTGTVRKLRGGLTCTVPSNPTNFCEAPALRDTSQLTMAPQLSEDEIDDLIYVARVGDNDDLNEILSTLAEREKVTPAEILLAARDEGKSTALHMATGNGHLGAYTGIESLCGA